MALSFRRELRQGCRACSPDGGCEPLHPTEAIFVWIRPIELATTTTRVAGRAAVRSASFTGLTVASGLLGLADAVTRAKTAFIGPPASAASEARRSARGAEL